MDEKKEFAAPGARSRPGARTAQGPPRHMFLILAGFDWWMRKKEFVAPGARSRPGARTAQGPSRHMFLIMAEIDWPARKKLFDIFNNGRI